MLSLHIINSIHSATKFLLFDIVHGLIIWIYLLYLCMSILTLKGNNRAEFVKRLHEKAMMNIERRTKQYVKHANKGRHKFMFEHGDWVWLHLRKERFLV